MIPLSPFIKKSGRGVVIGLACTLLIAAIWFLGFLDIFEAKTWDLRQRIMAGTDLPSDEIAVILLDQDSLDWGKEENGLPWPWPREVYAFIVSFCERSGATVLSFDVLYLEPSAYGVYDDEAFGNSVENFGNFIGTVFLGEETGSLTAWPDGVPKPGLVVDGLDDWLDDNRSAKAGFSRAAFPIPELSEGARYLANVHLDPDSDGIFRAGSLFQVFDGVAVPSFALAAYLAGSPESVPLQIQRRKFIIGDYTIPLDEQGQAIMRFRGPSGTHSTITAAAVIQSELRILSGEEPTIDPAQLKDKYVFFGYSAPGLHDLRPSPVSGVFTGVEIHATMLDNLLSRGFMSEVSRIAAVLIAVVFAVAAGIVVSTVQGGLKSGIGYGLFILIPPAVSLLLFTRAFWFPLMFIELAVVATLIGSGLVNYATEGKQKRFIKNAFQQYLSPKVIEQLIVHPDRLKLGGERRELSIFFSDLQGFTGISEGLSPEELTALLNDYLSVMTDVIQEEGGTVDKYEGDAIIAFWNAPLDLDDHAVRAVRSALRCQEELARMRPEVKKRIGKDLYMRIGLNTGPAVVGNMGSHNRFDYTMLGDAVNLAARLEGINKQFDTFTMISENTLQEMEDAFPVRELSRVAVVGRKEPVTVYEPMPETEFIEKGEVLSVFDAGLKAFYAGEFTAAEKIFQSNASSDPASGCYAEKCRELLENPPENWTGVWVMTSK